MKLKDYLKQQRMTHADAGSGIGVSRVLITNIANEKQAVSPKLAIRIEGWTKGKVTRHDLRPDLWP